MKIEIPKGFKSYEVEVGIKANNHKPDLALILSTIYAKAAAVFTKNNFVGEPIKFGRKIIKDGELQAIIINSGCANVATGKQGYENCKLICSYIADKYRISPSKILPSSTGVIGVQLPIEKIIEGIKKMPNWENMPEIDPEMVAMAINTTDRWNKFISKKVGNATLLGITKGAGMIEPNMATMLAYFFTDADLSSEFLKNSLQNAINCSFNCITVDSDMSTSDTVAIMANGIMGEVNKAEFQKTFIEMCIYLAKEIVRNGEGVTKLIEISVRNAKKYSQAKKIAKSVVNSPLVKTAMYVNDANWGRIAAAIGKAGELINPELICIYLCGYCVFFKGEPMLYNEDELIEKLKTDNISIIIDLGLGDQSCTVWGGDLSEGYIKENASYRS